MKPVEEIYAIIKAWTLAHEGAKDNPRLLLDYAMFSNLCVARMKVCDEADRLLYSLEPGTGIEPLDRHLRANLDKGCGACWVSSLRSKRHRDGSPSCNDKIHEWFESHRELMAFGRLRMLSD